LQLGDAVCFHVINRGHNREVTFTDDVDRREFLSLLARYRDRFGFALYHYCLMSNHFHLLLRLDDAGRLSALLAGLLRAYVHHCHRRHGFVGHRWQGRFKAFPIEEDRHLLTELRYVERNALRANIVGQAEDWPWSSLPVWLRPPLMPWLDLGPVVRPGDWLEYVQTAHTEAELAALRRSMERGVPYGSQVWVAQTWEELGVESSLHRPGRPRKRVEPRRTRGGLLDE
jgi:putative transposase